MRCPFGEMVFTRPIGCKGNSPEGRDLTKHPVYKSFGRLFMEGVHDISTLWKRVKTVAEGCILALENRHIGISNMQAYKPLLCEISLDYGFGFW